VLVVNGVRFRSWVETAKRRVATFGMVVVAPG
jgi:hypothetical protein